MDSKSVVRVGVSVLVVVGVLLMFAGPAVADDHCDVDGFCEDDGEEEPWYDGPQPDVGGAVTDLIDGAVEPITDPLPS